MWHVGIDLHRQTLVIAAVHDSGEVKLPQRFACSDGPGIVEAMKALSPFRAVVEATGTYRWLWRLLWPHGTVLLAHPLRLHAMLVRRSKTDHLDAQLLANLLRLDQIPLAYIPSEEFQTLRDLTRYRARNVLGDLALFSGGQPAFRWLSLPCISLRKNAMDLALNWLKRPAVAGRRGAPPHTYRFGDHRS